MGDFLNNTTKKAIKEDTPNHPLTHHPHSGMSSHICAHPCEQEYAQIHAIKKKARDHHLVADTEPVMELGVGNKSGVNHRWENNFLYREEKLSTMA